VLVHEAL
jgi:hypothetical protein